MYVVSIMSLLSKKISNSHENIFKQQHSNTGTRTVASHESTAKCVDACDDNRSTELEHDSQEQDEGHSYCHETEFHGCTEREMDPMALFEACKESSTHGGSGVENCK